MFHVNLPVDTRHIRILITVRLLFIHKTIGCVHQTRPRKGTKGIQLPVLHTLSDHRICHGVRPIGRHVKNGSFSSSNMNCMSMHSITEVFYHLNKMIIATIPNTLRTIILSLSKTAHWHILYATCPNH